MAPTQKRQGWPQNLLPNADRRSENLVGHKKIKGNFKEKVLLLILPKSWGARAALTPSVRPALLPFPNARRRFENLVGHKKIKEHFKKKGLLLILPKFLWARAPLTPSVSSALLPQKQLEWPQSHLLLSPGGRSENLRGQKEIEGLVLLARSLRASAPLAPPISPALLPLPLLSSHQQVCLISLISKRWSKLCRLCIKENILKVKGNWLLWNICKYIQNWWESMASLLTFFLIGRIFSSKYVGTFFSRIYFLPWEFLLFENKVGNRRN